MIIRALLLVVLATPLLADAPKICGHVEVVDGTKVAYFWGTPYERGFAEGYLFAGVIATNIEEFALSRFIVPRPSFWDSMVVPAVKRRFRFAERDLTWAKGVLAGLEARRGRKVMIPPLKRHATLDDVLVCGCIPDLAGMRCSSFAAWGPLVAKGLVVGRNLDYFGTPTMTRSSMVKVQAADGDRAAWISIGWPGFGGCITGLSERGIWVAIHDVFRRPESFREQFTSRVHALETLVTTLRPGADVPAKGREILKKHRFAMGCNAMLAWHGEAGTGGVVMEFDGIVSKEGGVTVRQPTDGASVVVCSNHHRVRGATGHSCGRFRAIANGATAGPKINIQRGWKVITAASVRMTIYRCAADLGAGVLEVDRRLAPKKEKWSRRLKLDTKKLFAEVTRRAAKK